MLIRQKLFEMASSSDSHSAATITFSPQTSASRTQQTIEAQLEKRRRNVLAPKGGRRLLLLIDDLNMPRADAYGAQAPLELLRQYQDCRGFYDRDKLFWKEVYDVTLAAACAPPGAGGRSAVSGRLLRHFATL